MESGKAGQKRICFFGHFGSSNFGNESTLLAVLFNLRRFSPNTQVVCACTEPEALVKNLEIEAVPVSGAFFKCWNPRSRVTALLRRVCIGVPNELWRVLQAIKTLRKVDMLIIPGTGLITDAYGLMAWGPYNLLKWTLIARMCRCRVLFVSVGAGPVYSSLGKFLIKAALSLADFRSYRDKASLECLEHIGFKTNRDAVYPDLVFSLPEKMLTYHCKKTCKRPIVGLGLMTYAGRYSSADASNTIYERYLENLMSFVRWLLAHDYDIRLIIGDADDDKSVSKDFKPMLTAGLELEDQKRIMDQPAVSVEQLLNQIAETDFIVATRFHNVLLALLLNKPVMAISFHHKCTSLMNEMGMIDYCHDINQMNVHKLIDQFQDMRMNSEKLKRSIGKAVERSRKALDEQYRIIFSNI